MTGLSKQQGMIGSQKCSPAATLASLLVLLAMPAHAEDSVLISKNAIWSNNMAGTKRFVHANLDAQQSLTASEKITQRLRQLPQDKPVMSGFAYAGEPEAGPNELANYLEEGAATQKEFSPSENVTIAFFTGPLARYAEVQTVTRDGTTIRINCQFVPHRSREISTHFAFASLGKLPPGTYHVAVLHKQLDSDSIYAATEPDSQVLLRNVSQPFEFSVSGP